MAKGSKKKNKAKNGGGAAAMDTSEGAPATSTAAEAPERNFVPLCLFFLISDLLVFHSLMTRIFRSFFSPLLQRWIRPRGSSSRRHPLRSVRSTGERKRLQQLIFFS
jgi:hypothetical protein